MTKDHRINIALVCTRGGHYEQMTNLEEFYKRYPHFWITNRNKQTESQLGKERAYYIDQGHFKKPWTYLTHLAPVLRIFRNEKPTHMLSTGSGRTAFIPFLLSRLLKVNVIYIETFSRVHRRSIFGAFLLKTGNKIFTQWEDPTHEKAIYIGPIFKNPQKFSKGQNSEYIFVTVGTRNEPFTRLLKGVEELVKKGSIKERVIVQAGHTKYSSEHVESFDFCTPEKVEDLILNARYVITQESAGIGTQCLKYQTRFIVMPRNHRYGELPAKSDMNEDLHYKLEELGFTKVVTTTEELERAIMSLGELRVGFDFNNRLAISTLEKAMEEI